MRPRHACVIAVLFGALSLAPSAACSQNAPLRTVTKVLARYDEPFSGLTEVRELSDGRVIVLDARENTLFLVRGDLGDGAPIGRKGSGPTEYQQVMQLIARPADSTLAYDIRNARFLVIDRSGAPVSTISLRDAAGGLPIGPMAVRGYDSRGRLYYQGMSLTVGKQGPVLSDTAPIIRLDGKAKRTDTLTYVRIGAPQMRMSGDMQKGTGQMRVGTPAFPTVDEWALVSGDAIAVVRGATYQFQVLGGAAAVTATIPYAKVPVTDADKAKVREANDRVRRDIVKATTGTTKTPSGQTVRMPQVTLDEPTEWPKVKPPFAAGALRLAPDGSLWVLRARAAREEEPLFDVLDPKGRLVMRVELPAKHRLVGIGTRGLYVVRVDEDDLEYLQRMELPR